MSEHPQWLVQDSLLATGARSPGATAVITPDVRLDYGELLERSLRLARGLQDAGVQRGDRVAIHMENGIPYAVSIFATLLAGGVFVPVNAQTKPAKLAFLLEDCEAALLLTEPRLAAATSPAVGGIASLRGVVPSLDELAASSAEPRDPGTVPVDLAALIYTSGTTDKPKGVMLTHRNMVFATESVACYLGLTADDRLLNVLPLAFSYGLYQLLLATRLGASLVLERSFAFPAEIVARMQDHDVTVFPGVPTMFATLRSLTNLQPRFENVTCVTNAGAALPPEYVPSIREIFPRARLYLMYGQTECKRVCYLDPELVEQKPSSVGKAMPGTEAFVLDEHGRRATPGEVGVLHVRGPHVMAGYWRRPDLTEHVLRDGPVPGERMLCTHDYFKTDEDGDLYFVARSDDVIKTRGEKVSPVEVENVLYSVAGVREAAVVGVPDEILGQSVRAFVALDEAATVSEQDLLRECRARLENYMVPREIVVLESLPKTASGKITKTELRAVEPTRA